MIPLDPAGLEAAARQLAETAEVVRAYLAAAGRAAATPDPPDEAAIRADERERLSARVYENGWCPTCAATPAPASPDERLREAAGALVVAAACAVCEPGPFHDNDDHLQWKLADAITATRAALAAADREKPKRNHAPWCEGGHGDRPCPAPPVPDEPKEKP